MITLPQLLVIVTGILTIAASLFVVAFIHIEQVYLLLSWIYRLLSWINKRFRLKAVTSQVQSRINVGVELIESEVPGVMPHPLKIDWIGRGEEYAQLKDGQIVVRIRNELNNAKNIVATTMLYLQEGLLRSSRPYIDQKLLQALDLNIAWKLIEKNEESDIADYFLNKVYNPFVDNDPIIAFDCEKINVMDLKGLMTRIFMRELRGVGLKSTGPQEKPTIDLKNETRNFSDFLYTIATSEKGAVYQLNFFGRKIKAGILPVAALKTLAMSGLHVHKRWFRKKIKMGVETTYVIAFGDRNINLASNLAQWAQNEGLVGIVRNQTFDASSRSGEIIKNIVITCHSSYAKADTILDPIEELQATLVRWITEIATGEIEVLYIAREPGILSKVVIRSITEGTDPVRQCIGRNDEKIKKVRDELNESVWFIPFSEDPQKFYIDCLGIQYDSLKSINIDSKKKQVNIVVKDPQSAALAVGSKGINVRLAEQITGLHINILTADQKENSQKPQPAKSPEELLKQAIIQQIPEVANGAITIVDVVREPGIQSKVIVRPTSGQDKAMSTCVGENRKHVQKLIKELGESIWFIEYSQDPKSYLVGCLVINSNKVISVNINQSLRNAEILVTDKMTCAKAIGENGINVKQAMQLTGLRFIRIHSQEN